MNRISFIIEEKLNEQGTIFVARRENPEQEGQAYDFPLGINNNPYSAIIEICKRILEQQEKDAPAIIQPSDHDHMDNL